MVVTEAVRAQALGGIDAAYFWICGLIIALLFFFWFSRRIVNEAVPPAPIGERAGIGELIREAVSSRWALFGGLATFLYVGAEVAIGTPLAQLLHSRSEDRCEGKGGVEKCVLRRVPSI